MYDLEKALNCYKCIMDELCYGALCTDCNLYQTRYMCAQDAMDAATDRIHELGKSNRNWRRKVQRLRKEIKEVKHEE